MSRKKRIEAVTLSPSMLSLVRQIGKTKREIAKLKRDLKKINDLSKRKTRKNEKPIPFLEIKRRYGELERRSIKTCSILLTSVLIPSARLRISINT